MSLGPGRRGASLERTLIRQIFDEAPAEAINLGLGQPDLPTPPTISLAGVRAVAEGHTRYTTTAGDPRLRRAVAEEYAPFVSGAEQVTIHVGTQEALFATLLVLVDPGDRVLVPDPGYPGYAPVVRLVGAEPVPYPLRADNGFRLQPEEVGARIDGNTRAVIVCSPSNPTGVVHACEELQALADLLERRGVAWISDEIYAGFAYEGPVPSLREFSGDGLVISGVSKTLSMTGWRIGWVAGPKQVVARITAAHQYLVTCAPSVSQIAALAAFTAAGRAAAREYLETFRRRRARMAAALETIPRLRFRAPAGAFYFFVDVRAFGRSSLDLAREILLRKKVVTIPGVAFGPNGEGFLRLSFAASDADIDRGVAAIGELLAERG